MHVNNGVGSYWLAQHQVGGRDPLSARLANQRQPEASGPTPLTALDEPGQAASDKDQASSSSGVTVSLSPESRQASAAAQAERAMADKAANQSPSLSNPLLHSEFADRMGLGSRGPGASGGNAERDKDIEESGLPQEVQSSLKRIRDMKEQLKEKQEELKAVMNDASLSDEQKSEKIQQLNGEIAQLNTAIQSAQQSMGELMKSKGLSSEDQMKAMGLV
ncbi:hypothetical protein BFW38_02290 [Terasakiispira papahanaumokuakeensis]|uniref:Uncharacterized protein n=1 Tax=Terasakiispira papahanaumokuakeensis TaxID=197479 RepID=A0A1E2V6E0_9GAMM|nr:hypothetical protein [Terasakiispira papahanaumokuakeensis]ODC02547.1 hypothetical protein BFW38_02290 [Terasakiispira papahanaumokuakeensis]